MTPETAPSQALMLTCLLSSWLSASVAVLLNALSLPGFALLSPYLSGDKSHHSLQSVSGPGISGCCYPQGPELLQPSFPPGLPGASVFPFPSFFTESFERQQLAVGTAEPCQLPDT